MMYDLCTMSAPHTVQTMEEAHEILHMVNSKHPTWKFKLEAPDAASSGPSHGKKRVGRPKWKPAGGLGGAVSPPSGVRGSVPETFEKHAFFNNS